MFSVSNRLFWLLVMDIILGILQKKIFLLSHSSVDPRPVGRTRCTLQLQLWQISVRYGLNLGTFLCLVGVHGVCFLHEHLSDSLWCACKRQMQCESCRSGKELRTSCLIWCVSSFCQQSVVNYDSAVQKPHHTMGLSAPIPSLFAFQHADGCLTSYIGKASPPVTCDVQGPYRV